jgi:hypothetical protein
MLELAEHSYSIYRPGSGREQGMSLRVENGALLIRNGLSHYPQERETFRFFRGDLLLPSRIILLDGSGTTRRSSKLA